MKPFYAKLNVIGHVGNSNTLLSDKRYDELIEEVLTLKCSKTKNNVGLF